MIILWAYFFRQLIIKHLSTQNEANHGQKSAPQAHWILNLLSMLSIHIAPIYLNIRISPLHRLGNSRHERQEESSTSILCYHRFVSPLPRQWITDQGWAEIMTSHYPNNVKAISDL